MNVKKIAAGIGATTILAGGGVVTADQLQNPYTEVASTLQIDAMSTLPEAGTTKIIADETVPKVTLKKWNGEVAMGVTYQGISAPGSRPFLSKNVEWSDANQTMQAVPLNASATMADGGMEINILLNSAPTSNLFTFAITGAENLDFFYQPPLTADEIKNGDRRPDNVVGSYAVYYKNHANHIEGQTNYATGKAYHIFRPLVTDAKGNAVWADLSYSNGVLTVTVPQSFLDDAVYPVKVDPTFGYTTQGLSDSLHSAVSLDGSLFTAPANVATVTAINLYGEAQGGTVTFKGVIVVSSTKNITTNGISPASGSVGTTYLLTIMLYSPAPTVTPGTDYYLEAISSASNAIAFDAGNHNLRDQSNSYTSPTNPSLHTTFDDTRNLSIYVTYTAPAGPTPSDIQIQTNVNINSNVIMQ